MPLTGLVREIRLHALNCLMNLKNMLVVIRKTGGQSVRQLNRAPTQSVNRVSRRAREYTQNAAVYAGF